MWTPLCLTSENVGKYEVGSDDLSFTFSLKSDDSSQGIPYTVTPPNQNETSPNAPIKIQIFTNIIYKIETLAPLHHTYKYHSTCHSNLLTYLMEIHTLKSPTCS